MNERELIDKYSGLYCKYQRYGNAFVDCNPLSKLNVFVVLALSAFVAQDYRYGLLLCVFYCLLAACCGKFRAFIRVFARLVLLIGGVTILVRQMTIAGDTVLFSVFGWRWTWEALENALRIGTAILGFSGAVVLFYAVTSMRDLMYAFELKGMSHSASYIMLSAFQTVADLSAAAQTIFESQKARGIETDGSLFTRARAFLPVLGPLILGAMSSAEEKYIAMDARAFATGIKHTYLRELRPAPDWEKAVVAAVDLCFAAACCVQLYRGFYGLH